MAEPFSFMVEEFDLEWEDNEKGQSKAAGPSAEEGRAGEESKDPGETIEEKEAVEAKEALEEKEAVEAKEALEEKEAVEEKEVIEEKEAIEEKEVIEAIEEKEAIDGADEDPALDAAIEAVLFAMGNAVEIAQLAAALQVPQETVLKRLGIMKRRYEAQDRGIRIMQLENAYQLCTKKEYYDCLIRVAMHPVKPALTDVMLETLSIIAYKQPVTKAEIEKIRGVKSDHAVNRLVEFELVRELGRLDAPGRPILFGTTEVFLRTFGVEAIGELPMMDPVKLSDFRSEAEEEIQARQTQVTV